MNSQRRYADHQRKRADGAGRPCRWNGAISIVELFEAVDSYIPEPKRDNDKPFLMPVEDVFSITGRGTVATGRVERGVLKVGEEVEIIGLTEEKRR